MATNNAINANTAGLVRYNGTGTFDAVTTTNHDVLIGATSNGITNVAPSATSGVPLISQGSLADPVFGTVVVAGGGTGAVTLTNHSVLLGQGTSAVAFAGPGSTSGVPLIAQGSSADPVFGTAVVAGGGTGAVTLTNHGPFYSGQGTSAVAFSGPGATSGVPLIAQGSSSDPVFGTAVVAGGGTGAVTLTTHAVLLGQGTSAIAFAGPGATSGVPLIAQGASADPAFGTAVVAGGGTGATSFVAYTPVCGGTTTTGVLQSVASLGTSGQVLTSNGAGALPTFQTVGTPPFANSVLAIQDDFVSWYVPTAGNVQSDLAWISTSFVGNPTNLSTNPGLISQQAVAAGTASLSFRSNPNPFILGAGSYTINWVIKTATLSAASPRYVLQCGLADSAGTNPPNNGVFFNYSDNVNSGNWQGISRASSTSSTANSAIAAINSAYVNLGITVNAAATSVAFFINGTQIANSPLASNIPTVSLLPFIQVTATVGTVALSSVIADLFYMSIAFTTPR